MFDFVAKHKRYLQIVLGLTILPFAFFGVESYTRATRSSSDAASVDGTPVTMREFGDETRRQQDRLRRMLGADADLAMLDTPEMRLAILENLIAQRLMTNEVVNDHLTLSKEEVVAGILAAPEFQEGGKFSAERYANYLRAIGMSDEGNVMKLRLEIPAARLASAIGSSAMEPRTVVARLAAIEGEKREVAEAFLPSEAYLARVKPDEAAIKAYYESHLADYRVPARVRAEYLVLSAEALGQAEGASEEEIRKAYEAKAAELGVPEQRRASHILVATREEAEKLLAEARKNPQGFAELAKKYSQDTGSAANGGDLGMNPRGGLASKALEDAIFKTKPNEFADVVKSEFGYHVVRVTAVQPGKTRSLEDARKELAADIVKQKGAKKFAEAAESFNNLVYEQSDSLKPAAERYKLKIESTGWFSRQAPGDIGPLANPKLLAALFSQDSIKQRRNTDAVEVSPGVLVAARVAEYQPEAQRPMEEVRADIEGKLARREAAALARKEGEEKLAVLAKGGEAGLTWTPAKAVSRQESQGLPQMALRKVMAADAAKLPAYVGVQRGDEGYVLYRISKVVPPEPKTGPLAAEDQSRYDRQAGATQLDAYVSGLRAKAKINIRPLEPDSK
ncbi:MAG TPA: SurA N-terminal domain-containing protein [Burkholderiales bacterium]|nr:SurA N-terminal domain-containing protein [Burkholderiales bacterium]